MPWGTFGPGIGCASASSSDASEERIFDKADEKASLEDFKAERQKLQEEIKKLEEAQGGDADIARKQERMATIDAELDKERAAPSSNG